MVSPIYAPKESDAIEKGTIPGKSITDMQWTNEGLNAIKLCIANMERVVQYHDEGEPTWRETYDALREHTARATTWFRNATDD